MTVTDGECKWHLNGALRPMAKCVKAFLFVGAAYDYLQSNA
jgi:hypothetical protein